MYEEANQASRNVIKTTDKCKKGQNRLSIFVFFMQNLLSRPVANLFIQGSLLVIVGQNF